MPRPQRPRRRRCRPSCPLTVLFILIACFSYIATASPPTAHARRSLLTFGTGPAYPVGVGAGAAAPGTTTTPAASSSGNNNSGGGGGSGGGSAATSTTSTKLRTCAGPFEICPAPALCRNPNKGNEWCYWLYVDKASCVCL